MVSTKKEVKNYRFYPPPFYLYTSDNQILSNQTILSSNQNNLAAYSTGKHFLSNYILKNHFPPKPFIFISHPTPFLYHA